MFVNLATQYLAKTTDICILNLEGVVGATGVHSGEALKGAFGSNYHLTHNTSINSVTLQNVSVHSPYSQVHLLITAHNLLVDFYIV